MYPLEADQYWLKAQWKLMYIANDRQSPIDATSSSQPLCDKALHEEKQQNEEQSEERQRSEAFLLEQLDDKATPQAFAKLLTMSLQTSGVSVGRASFEIATGLFSASSFSTWSASLG